ncbi:DUF6283 family protein [Prescottella agglutinans]|uniref:Uncharacterized protein n=1 Tax=Prescottella agglutinans TaxID=1644129 RepID=A0ABT6MIK2_9NOCA|nr:DUF6283 family protein [Prescottella agglutinans]MDH6284065.1 hypothetical protein [Prescottella agglutinans]
MTAHNDTEPGSGRARASQDQLPHRRRPCAECPWRRDVAPGKFTSERFDALADTSGGPGCEAPLSAPMFACHKTREGAEQACAGWLAVAGGDHIGVRLAVIQGRLDPTTLAPGGDWPPLFDSYTEMADTQAG